MLAAVLSDGTAVNIVRRGDDIVSGNRHFVTVVGDNGAVYKLCATVDLNDEDEYRSVVVEDGVLSIVPNVTSVDVDGIILVFDTTSDLRCPEVLDWLCRNYGLTFSPAGLYLYESASVVATYAVTSSACIQDEGGNVFVLGSAQDDYALAFPSGSATVLGCDGSAVPNSISATVVPCASVDAIRDEYASDWKPAFNTWLFYLTSGLPKSLFEDL